VPQGWDWVRDRCRHPRSVYRLACLQEAHSSCSSTGPAAAAVAVAVSAAAAEHATLTQLCNCAVSLIVVVSARSSRHVTGAHGCAHGVAVHVLTDGPVCVCAVCCHCLQEGELRPQLLDRFGMSVNVRTLTDVGARTKLVLDRCVGAWGRKVGQHRVWLLVPPSQVCWGVSLHQKQTTLAASYCSCAPMVGSASPGCRWLFQAS
jgi:hypothetical protein